MFVSAPLRHSCHSRGVLAQDVDPFKSSSVSVKLPTLNARFGFAFFFFFCCGRVAACHGLRVVAQNVNPFKSSSVQA